MNTLKWDHLGHVCRVTCTSVSRSVLPDWARFPAQSVPIWQPCPRSPREPPYECFPVGAKAAAAVRLARRWDVVGA